MMNDVFNAVKIDTHLLSLQGRMEWPSAGSANCDGAENEIVDMIIGEKE